MQIHPPMLVRHNAAGVPVEVVQLQSVRWVPGNFYAHLTPSIVLDATAKHFGASRLNLIAINICREFARARHVAAYLTSDLTNATIDHIARVFRRDEKTIRTSIAAGRELIDTSEYFAQAADDIRGKLLAMAQ